MTREQLFFTQTLALEMLAWWKWHLFIDRGLIIQCRRCLKPRGSHARRDCLALRKFSGRMVSSLLVTAFPVQLVIPLHFFVCIHLFVSIGLLIGPQSSQFGPGGMIACSKSSSAYLASLFVSPELLARRICVCALRGAQGGMVLQGCMVYSPCLPCLSVPEVSLRAF